jgi:hypothetical protein
MARQGSFDVTASPAGWFDETAAPNGWFDPLLLDVASNPQAAGIDAGVTVWCDLEGVAPGTSAHDVIGYCNAWFDAVNAAGYRPGLYVGWHCGLTADELYHKLSFEQYWISYNLNADQVPSVRGAMMRQSVAQPRDLIAGFTNQDMDVDTIKADAMAGTPTLLFA